MLKMTIFLTLAGLFGWKNEKCHNLNRILRNDVEYTCEIKNIYFIIGKEGQVKYSR